MYYSFPVPKIKKKIKNISDLAKGWWNFKNSQQAYMKFNG